MLFIMGACKWRYKTTAYCHMLGLITVLLLQFIPTQQDRVRPIPPLITSEPQKVIVFKEHGNVQLNCVASGEPEPSYSWKKDGNAFNEDARDGRVTRRPGTGTLLFLDSQQQDEGSYQCFASNQAGIAVSAKIYLRRARLEPFPAAAIREHFPVLWGPLTLRCIPPASYPPPSIFWAITGVGSRLIPLAFTDRVTMDAEGNLHFVNILPEDERDGQRYTCIVQNNAMRSIQQGAYAVVRPQGATIHTIRRSGPSFMWHSPTHQVALRGETLRLKCICSGSPTPRVDWTRIEGNMTSRTSTDSFGMELVIQDVQFEDAGRYECQGINEEAQTPQRRTFTITVQSAPYWIQPMESQQAAEGATVEFFCKTGGIPPPINVWFINGIPSTEVPPNPRMVVEPDKLTIHNVSKASTAVMQCNSTNKHGYVWTNAYLSVLAEPPVLLVPPPPVLKAADTQTVQIPCKVFGSPKPQLSWTKHNQQLTGGKFRVLQNGSLEIKEVSPTDAGTYKCTAQNKFGVVSATGMLLVRERTRIIGKPRDRVVKERTMVTLKCVATTDLHEVVNLRIVWQWNGRQIDFQRAQRITQSRLDNSLTIASTISHDTGNYKCVASNGIDQDEWTAQLTVQGPPDPPNVMLGRCGSTRVEITWQPGRDNNAPIRNFIIQFNTSFAPNTWTTIENNVPQNDRRRFVYPSPWGNYTFRVLARNKIGTSHPSLHTRAHCAMRADRPYKNPQNVMGEGDEPGNLIIFWTPMPQLEWNAPDFRYKITWQPADVENAPVNTAIINDGKRRYFITPISARPYAPFNIKVKAANSEGEAIYPPVSVLGHAGEDHPVVAPSNLMVDAATITANQAVLTWSHVDQSPEAIRGFFMGYRIEFWRTGDNGENMRQHDYIMNDPRPYPIPRRSRRDAVNAGDTIRSTVLDLPAFSIVTFQVRVLNKYYAGPGSDQIQFSTPEGKPGPPPYFRIVNQGPTYFDLEWAKPQEANGIIMGYRITYQTVSGLRLGVMHHAESITDSDASSVQLTGLLPDTVYRLHLAAYTLVGMGEPIYVQRKTLPVPPQPTTTTTTEPPPK